LSYAVRNHMRNRRDTELDQVLGNHIVV